MNRRHIHVVCLVLLLFLPYIAFAQGSITPITYQYWWDDNTGGATTYTENDTGGGIDIYYGPDVSGTGPDTGLDLSDFSPGVHYFNIRAAVDGQWGTVHRYLFSIPAIPDDVDPSHIAGYEYWMDNDYEHREFTDEIPFSDIEEHNVVLFIDIDDYNLTPGVHYYNIRFWGSDEKWSTTQRYIFSIPVAASGSEPANLKNVEYWIDDDYANRVRKTASGSQTTTEALDMSEVDVSSLAPGVHYYNMRAQDADGKWSAPQRYIFSIPAAASSDEPANLKNVEYWIDDDYANRVRKTTSGSQTTTEALDISEVDVSSLAPGVHYYNMRAQDADGKWGAPQRFIFSIPATSSSATAKNLDGFEYWIDDDYANRKSRQANDNQWVDEFTIDLSSYSPGVHYYNMRAKDLDGKWGTVQRYLFSIPTPQPTTAGKLIAGYTYAFNFEDPTFVALETPVEEYTLELSDLAVPAPSPLTVVDDECTMTFDATAGTAQLSRNVPMTFAIYFKDQGNTLSAPTVEEFEVNDVITENVQAITSPGTYDVESHDAGGYSAMSFEVESSTTLALKTNGDCSLRVYNPNGKLFIAYESTALQAGVTRTFAEGTYYAIVFGNIEACELALYPGDEEGMEALKPAISYDEDSHVVTISSALNGAIYYTTDGSDPTLESTKYTASFTASNDMTVKAIAAWGDMVVSPIRSYMISELKGDASGDGTIDMADVTAIINYILGKPNSTFAENLADMNGDDVVDIFDAMLLLNYIINHSSGARAMARGAADEPTEQITIAAEQKNIYIGIDQAERFTSFQFDLTLPAGTELTDVKLASGANTHRFMFAHRGANSYRVVGYSLSNAQFTSDGDKLIQLQLSDAAQGDVSVDNILFVTPSVEKVWMASKSISFATQIDGVEMDTEAKDIYKLNGQKLDNSRKQLDKGVYIINHKKVIIK